MLKNIFKIAILGVIGFGLLIYLTAEKPQVVNASESITSALSLKNVPDTLEIVGSEKLVQKSELFNSEKTLLIVGNHDSLSVVKDLKKYFEIELPYVMVANISNAPWFIKKWAIPGKLEELNQGTNIPMIYDYEGTMVKSLNLSDTTKTSFFAYLVEANGTINKIYAGEVKEDAMEGSMNDLEKKTSLEPLVKLLK